MRCSCYRGGRLDPPEVDPRCVVHGYDEDGPSPDARLCEVCLELWEVGLEWELITVAGADGGPEDVLVPPAQAVDEKDLLRGWERTDVERQTCPECRRER